ncbi:MAG: hypothetical protein ABWY57_11480 [Mycetocola sp.]
MTIAIAIAIAIAVAADGWAAAVGGGTPLHSCASVELLVRGAYRYFDA